MIKTDCAYNSNNTMTVVDGDCDDDADTIMLPNDSNDDDRMMMMTNSNEICDIYYIFPTRSADGSSGYVPALTRTSALGKLEPVNRGPVKKKYAVVKTLPQVRADYPANYPSHSLSSSTSNASTIRSSSCPPVGLTDDEVDDDVVS